MQTRAYAEEVLASSTALVALPDGVTFEAAVASGVNALVAHFCIAKARLTADETVFVRGARGGIGHRDSAPVSADGVIDLVAGSDTGAYLQQLNANGRYVIARILPACHRRILRVLCLQT
jgi:NADPH2:quinone reductase